MPKHAGVPATLTDRQQFQREAARAINGLLLGKSNNTGIVTLGTGTTTTITNTRITPETVVLLTPRNAKAAAAIGGIYLTYAPGIATINHAPAAAADRDFDYAIVGG